MGENRGLPLITIDVPRCTGSSCVQPISCAIRAISSADRDRQLAPHSGCRCLWVEVGHPHTRTPRSSPACTFIFETGIAGANRRVDVFCARTLGEFGPPRHKPRQLLAVKFRFFIVGMRTSFVMRCGQSAPKPHPKRKGTPRRVQAFRFVQKLT